MYTHLKFWCIVEKSGRRGLGGKLHQRFEIGQNRMHCVKLRDAGDFVGGGREGGGWQTYLASQHHSRHLLLTPPVSPGASPSHPKFCKYPACQDSQNPKYPNMEIGEAP